MRQADSAQCAERCLRKGAIEAECPWNEHEKGHLHRRSAHQSVKVGNELFEPTGRVREARQRRAWSSAVERRLKTATHLAARMEQMTQPGAILLTPETLALAEGSIQVTSRGPVPVKGVATPIEIFELSGVSPVRSRLHAAASRGLTRFVGRDAEIELLRHALGRAGDGHGQVVAVVGEPGVGKSRLVWEFTHSHRSQGWLVLETGSVSYGKATMYFPVIELLRRYFALEVRDDVRRMREKVTGKLLSLDRGLEHTLPVSYRKSRLEALRAEVVALSLSASKEEE